MLLLPYRGPDSLFVTDRDVPAHTAGCRRLASRVTNKDASPFGSLEQRIDVWSNAELPFGIAQFQLATSEMSPRELTSRTTWSATAAGKLLTPSAETQE